ncbi:MAG: DUF2461 domain-containing protein [Bacteroidota bacterium]
MVQKEYIFRFLRDLRNNNSKEWMDEHRDRYHTAKSCWLAEIERFLALLGQQHEPFAKVKPKSTISRINNNRRFHPDRPTYKDYFTFDLSENDISILHVSVSPGNSFIGAGMHRPASENLKKFYQAIDYDGDKFKAILSEPQLKDFFGALTTSERDLKTAPQGFSQDHPHIEILRRKSITLMRELTEEKVCSDDFPTLVKDAYLMLRPFHKYLVRAINFEA